MRREPPSGDGPPSGSWSYEDPDGRVVIQSVYQRGGLMDTTCLVCEARAGFYCDLCAEIWAWHHVNGDHGYTDSAEVH